MEIAVGLIGLVAAILGVAAALLSRRQEVVHRHEEHDGSPRAPGEAPPRRHAGLGALVYRSTLFGFAIGTFFGVTGLSIGLLFTYSDRFPNQKMGFIFVFVIPIACSLIGTLAGLCIGMRLAKLSARENRHPDTEPHRQTANRE